MAGNIAHEHPARGRYRYGPVLKPIQVCGAHCIGSRQFVKHAVGSISEKKLIAHFRERSAHADLEPDAPIVGSVAYVFARMSFDGRHVIQAGEDLRKRGTEWLYDRVHVRVD